MMHSTGLYEFLGQEYINHHLHRMGYDQAQLIHRLEVSLSEEENRFTNPVRFTDSTGKILYEKAAENSQLSYATRNTRMGNGYLKAGQLVNEPFDFSKKNRLTLTELNNIVKSIHVSRSQFRKHQRFNLTAG
jgi:hypothetical protein